MKIRTQIILGLLGTILFGVPAHGGQAQLTDAQLLAADPKTLTDAQLCDQHAKASEAMGGPVGPISPRSWIAQGWEPPAYPSTPEEKRRVALSKIVDAADAQIEARHITCPHDQGARNPILRPIEPADPNSNAPGLGHAYQNMKP